MREVSMDEHSGLPQAIFSPADPPLSFTGFEPGKLLDFVLPSAVVRVFLNDCQQFFQSFEERGVSL